MKIEIPKFAMDGFHVITQGELFRLEKSEKIGLERSADRGACTVDVLTSVRPAGCNWQVKVTFELPGLEEVSATLVCNAANVPKACLDLQDHLKVLAQNFGNI